MTAPGVPVRIAIAAGALAAALIGLVVREGAARAGGTEVLLQIEGFDPRSLLTGHYVQFQMVREGPAGAVCPKLGREGGWVALRREGRQHVVVGRAGTRDAARLLGEVAVRGSVECGVTPHRPAVEPISLDLGIERFHASQSQAKAIEKALFSRDGDPAEAFAAVSIGADGRARLKALVIDGQRHNLDWL